jgi:hypothetical protein
MHQQKSILLELLTLEVGIQIPSDDASYAWRIPTSFTPLWDRINLEAVRKSKMKDRYWEKFGTFWNVKERVKVWSCIVWVHTYISSVKFVFLQKCYLSLYLSYPFWNCPPSGIRFCIYFPGIKRPGRGVNHPPLSRIEVEYGTAVRVGQPFVTSVSLIAVKRRFFFPDLFLGAFAKWRKLLVASSCLSACLPVCPSALNSWAATE